MDRCYLFSLIFYLIMYGCICADRNQYGMISVVEPAFVNREVTLKATPFSPWGCDVAWRFIMDGNTRLQTMNGTNAKIYSKDGSFFLKWKVSSEYNGSNFYASCSTNETIKTSMTSLNITDIAGQCGALIILSPVVRGAEVKLGYFPSDQSLERQINTARTWKKDTKELQLRNGSYEEEMVSEYLYILTIFNFNETFEGCYTLNCNLVDYTNFVQLHIPEKPSYPVLGPKSPDFITTECIYVYGGSDIYCKTENGTEPVQVLLSIEQKSFVLSESHENKGSYRFHNVHQQMAGLLRQNVTCQVSNSALEAPYEVHGTLCNVEKGSPPILTVPEFLDGESSTAICEVHNAIPAPKIELYVDSVLLADVQQTDSFNISSYTFTSRVKATKTYTMSNGKEMCCTRHSKHDFGFKSVPICLNISMKYPPSDLSISVNKMQEYSNNVFVCFFNMSCETDGSNPPCTIEWSSDNDNLRYLQSTNWTKREGGSFRSVSNVLFNVTKDMAGVTITCSTKCDHFPSHLNASYVLSFSGSQPHDKVNQTFSSTSRFPVVNKVLIGIGVFCGFCILLIIGIGRCVLLKRRKANEINTIEIVEHHSGTSSDSGVLHIATEGVQYVVPQRQAATHGIETQQQHGDDGLAYADLDINFIQEAISRVSSSRKNTPTEYADIEFPISKAHVKDYACQNASDEC
ncbi:uncharacterized protein LOC128233467 [Mya arenaria]|uniref:uncharacterized protein LOC128233467 n=1 Tax=Mya arenaria TaxID=6604 RepID=UPI0022E42F64|nr:uncharacterized protein LOC128233467 [Mya arenaria]